VKVTLRTLDKKEHTVDAAESDTVSLKMAEFAATATVSRRTFRKTERKNRKKIIFF
jgi:hypothetical protein